MLTPDERRGAVTLLVLLLIGAAWDALRSTPRPDPSPAPGGGAPVAGSPVELDAPPSASGAPRAPARADSVPALDLNHATAVELEALPGIGPVMARRIVEHRRIEGPFRSVDELRAVRGVGPRLMERLRGRIRVRAAP